MNRVMILGVLLGLGLGAAPGTAAAQGDAPPASSAGWELVSEPSAGGGTNVWLTSYAEMPVAGRAGGEGQAALTIRCLDGTPAAYVGFADRVMTDDGMHGQIVYQLDQLLPKTLQMMESAGNEFLGLWDGGRSLPFIRTLMGQRNVNVRVSPAEGEPIVADFPIVGLVDAIRPLRAACHF